MLLYNSGPDCAHLEGGAWAVSAEGGGFYRVDLDAESCTCPDYEHRAGPLGIACKHVYALAIAHAARRSGVKVRQIGAAGDPFKAAGSRRLRELRDVVRHDLDEQTREEARTELRRLRR
jgi:uncharacterized Zn finger protein